MKTTNWQTIALTLFIAAAALWLTTACTSAGPTNVAPTTQEATEFPTQKPTQTSTVATPTPQVGCTHETPGLRSWLNTTEEEYVESLPGDTYAPRFVLNKYEDLFWRQPNVYDVSIGQLLDDQGEVTKTWAITVWVTEKVEQATLPPEDRIPDILDTIRIRILDTDQPPRVPDIGCDYSRCGVNQEKGGENMTNPDPNTRIDPAELARRQGPSEYRVRKKYEPLFMRQPNVWNIGEGLFTDENDENTGESGIVVFVTKKVDQSTLPPEDRIPDCLEGVPVQVKEQFWFMTTGSKEKGDN